MTIRNLIFGIWLYVCFFMACTQPDEYSVCATSIGETQVAAFEQGADLCGADVECIRNEARQRILITAEYVAVCEKSDAAKENN